MIKPKTQAPNKTRICTPAMVAGRESRSASSFAARYHDTNFLPKCASRPEVSQCTMREYWRHKEKKLVIIPFFNSSLPVGGKLFINSLHFTLVCRRTKGEKDIFTKELEFFCGFCFGGGGGLFCFVLLFLGGGLFVVVVGGGFFFVCFVFALKHGSDSIAG